MTRRRAPLVLALCLLWGAGALAQGSPLTIKAVRDLPQGGQVTAHALSPNGGLVAAVVLAKQLRVWDANSGKLQWELAADVRELAGDGRNPAYLAKPVFSPNGELLALVANGEAVLLHADGTLLARVRGHQRAEPKRQGEDRISIVDLRFSADGRSLMTYTRGTAMLFRLDPVAHAGWLRRQLINYRGPALLEASSTFSPRDPGRGFVFHEVLFAGNGQELLATSTSHVHAWSLDTGRELRAVAVDSLSINRPEFLSSDAAHAALCLTDSVSLAVLDKSRPTLELKRHYSQPIAHGANCRFSPDGRFVVSWQSAYPIFNLHVWDTSGRELIGFHEQPGDRLAGVEFSGDGKRLFSIDQTGTLRIFELDQGTLEARLPGEHSMVGRTRSVSDRPVFIPLSADRTGRRVVVQERERLRVFELTPG